MYTLDIILDSEKALLYEPRKCTDLQCFDKPYAVLLLEIQKTQMRYTFMDRRLVQATCLPVVPHLPHVCSVFFDCQLMHMVNERMSPISFPMLVHRQGNVVVHGIEVEGREVCKRQTAVTLSMYLYALYPSFLHLPWSSFGDGVGSDGRHRE